MSLAAVAAPVASDDERRKIALALLERLRPCYGRLVVSEPRAVSAPKRQGPLHIPELGRRSCGMICRVILAHDRSEIPPGTYVFIDEFAGSPLYDESVGYLPYWVIGEGDCIAVLTDEDALTAPE